MGKWHSNLTWTKKIENSKKKINIWLHFTAFFMAYFVIDCPLTFLDYLII